MERELEVARDIQTRVFPRSMPAVAGYDVAGWSRPADQTGGDIYDVLLAGDGDGVATLRLPTLGLPSDTGLLPLARVQATRPAPTR